MPNEICEHSLYAGLLLSEILNMKKVMLLSLKLQLSKHQFLVFSKAKVNMMAKDTWFRWLMQQTLEDLQPAVTADTDKSTQ
jgi:hypothetical protein